MGPLILIEKGLVLEGSTPKIEDKQVPGNIGRFFLCDYETQSSKQI